MKPPATKHSAHIAIIDDSELTLALAAEVLQDAGYEVTPIDTPIGAVIRLGDRPPDLVLVDLNMASLSGERVIQTIRKDPRLGAIPLLIYSDQDANLLRAAVDRSGANGFISKTSNFEQFLAAIVDWLG